MNRELKQIYNYCYKVKLSNTAKINYMLVSSSRCHPKINLGTLSKDDDDDRENLDKKMSLPSFKLNRVYLDPLNMSNVGDFSWS